MSEQNLYYMSFACTSLATSVAEALTISWLEKLNPGGEVMFVELPLDAPIKKDYIGRLLNREELTISGTEPDKEGVSNIWDEFNGH